MLARPFLLACSVGYCVGALATPKPLATPNPKLKKGVLWVPCDPTTIEKGDSWQRLAKAIRENPAVNYFSVEGRVWGESYPMGSEEVSTWTAYRWFYSKKAQRVDFKEEIWHPAIGMGAVNVRKLYQGLTPLLIEDFARSHVSKLEPRVFDDFCARNGVYVLSYPTPTKQNQERK